MSIEIHRDTEREKGTHGEKEKGRTRSCLERNSCANEKWRTKSGGRDMTVGAGAGGSR